MQHIINNDYSVVNRFYTFKGVNYEIFGTRATDWNVKSAIDRVRNLKTGNTKEVSRIKLYMATRKENEI